MSEMYLRKRPYGYKAENSSTSKPDSAEQQISFETPKIRRTKSRAVGMGRKKRSASRSSKKSTSNNAKKKTSAAQKRRELRQSIQTPILVSPIGSRSPPTTPSNDLQLSVLNGLTFSTPRPPSKKFKQENSGFVPASEVRRRSIVNTSPSGSFTDNQLHLSSWSLPDGILKSYNEAGIVTMFEWQAECLQRTDALQGKNLIYSAPTSAGKTLVSEMLILKRVLETQQKAIFILPFVSITMEKTAYLKKLFRSVGLTVEAFVGTQSPKGGLVRCDVAVCTIEKANSMVNRLVEGKELSQLGVVVVDELHMAGDPSRGYLLELLLTKIRFVCMQSPNSVQIIGMSATLPNLGTLASWLDADLYSTDYRPVPLTEYVKVGSVIYDKEMTRVREVKNGGVKDPDGVIGLCRETVAAGHSVLLFCPTKIQCENLAHNISQKLGVSCPEAAGVVRQLEATPVGVDPRLAVTVPHGVAFHHAGLTMDERRVIETAFRRCSLRVLVATSTLSSGVNLPARRVIIRTPIFHGRPLDTIAYKQMTGRAGRKGVDTDGESVLVCKETERAKGFSLIQSQLKPVTSCLLGEGVMKRALLEIIAGGVALTPDDVESYTSCTLLAAERTAFGREVEPVKAIVADSLDFLHQNEFIFLCYGDQESYRPTQFGAACLASALSPEEALVVLNELQRARKGFVLENELHLVYQVTPIFLQRQWPNPNWYQFLRLWEKLPPDMRRVADRVGVEESFLSRAVYGRVPERDDRQKAVADIHRRFFMAMALNELVHEAPLGAVASRYGVARGTLQSLQQSAATFAGMVTVFCQRLNWKNMELLLSQFQSRLCFGVERELCDLVQISLLNGQRARTLYNGGYRSLASIALASPVEIETTLRKVTPFMSAKDSESSDGWSWVCQLRLDMTEAEAAEAIVEEAKSLVVKEKDDGDDLKPCGLEKNQNLKKREQPVTSELPTSNDRNIPTTSEAEPLDAAVESSSNDGSQKQDDPDSTSAHLRPSFVLPVAQTPTAGRSFAGPFSMSTPVVENRQDCNRKAELGSPILPVSSRTVDSNSECNFTMPEFSFETLQLMEAACHAAERSSQTAIDSGGDDLPFVDSTHLSTTAGRPSFCIIDVAAKRRLFQTFMTDWKGQKRWSVALACSRGSGTSTIGTHVLRRRIPMQTASPESLGCPIPDSSEIIEGIAVSWQAKDAYFVSLAPRATGSSSVNVDDDSLAEAGVDPGLNLSERLSAVAAVLRASSSMQVLFDVKAQIKKLRQACGISLTGTLLDPKVGDWMLQPDEKEKNFHSMLMHYLPNEGNRQTGDGLVFLATNPGPSRQKACAEAVLLLALMNRIETRLNSENLTNPFIEVEMPAVVSLAQLEMNGLDFSVEECERQKAILEQRLSLLETEAYHLAGRRFSLSSPDEISRVLFHELKLTPPEMSHGGKKTMGVSKTRRLQKFSTTKVVLEKLTGDHRLPSVILEWRRIENAVSKTLIPLLKHRQSKSGKVFAVCQTHTSTGRVTICDPCLQSVPKEFDIGTAMTVTLDSPILLSVNKATAVVRRDKSPPRKITTRKICMRDLFVASPGCVLLAADYSQLELRLTAHLSGDEKLIRILSDGGDVFRSIAGEWRGIAASDVTAEQRQQAKKICYGMIYGIGAKGLAEQLDVGEDEAARFMASFKAMYEGLKAFLQTAVDCCRELGYVKTILGRRRYLPAIRSSNVNDRSQAERQAVNSTVQGSAADLVKKAMVNIDAALEAEDDVDAGLVLQMHDELIYNVQEEALVKVGRIVKREMERAISVSVPLPVKLEFGLSWGTMQTLELD